MLEFHQFHSAKKFPKGIRLENHFLQLETAKKKTFITENFFKKRKMEEKNFMKVSGKSHIAEDPKESFMLAKRFVSSKKSGGASMKTN